MFAYPDLKGKEAWQRYFEELGEQGVNVIDDLFQVELMRNFVLRKMGDIFYVTNLTFTDKEKVLVSLLSVTPNRQYPYLNIQHDVTVLTTEGWARPVTAYCEDLLNVEVEGPASLGNLNFEIYKVGSGIDTQFVMEAENGLYRDIITGENFPAFAGKNGEPGIWDSETNELMPNVIVYNDKEQGGQTCTNGQLKRGNITLVANNLSSFPVNDVWNAVTYGAADILCDGSEATPKDIAQANTRLAAFKAPSSAISDIKTYAVFMGKLIFQMKPKGDEYNDGFGYLAAEFLGEALTSLEPDKYFFAPWACDGLTVQKRSWLNKIMAEVVRRSYINEMISHLGIQTVILERGKISEEDCEEFVLGVKSKGKKGKFAGKIVIICDNPAEAWKIDLFTDLNGLKAPFDPNTRSGVEILDMSHEEHDINHGSRTSTQLLQSLMIADPERTMAFIDRLGQEYIAAKEEALTADEGSAPSWMDFQGSCDYQQLLGRIAPKFAHRYYAPLWHTLVDAALKGYVKACRRLNLPTKGAYTKIVIDSAADFGRRILGVNSAGEVEIIAPVAEKHDISRVVGVKYPKQGSFEYLKGRVISTEEYENRILADIMLSDAQKKEIIHHVHNLSGGAVMIPAIATIKHMLAGLDVDGDAMQLFFDEELVDIVWTIEPRAVMIDETDVTVHDAYEEALG